VIVNSLDQKRLLEIVDLDLELARNSNETAKLVADTQIEAASNQALALSDQLIDARNRVGDLELELKRSELDLELVENRIAKDKHLLGTTSSTKDAQGIEHELTSLNKRKGELEETELGVMEELENLRSELQKVTDAKQQAETNLHQLRTQISEDSSKLADSRSQLLTKKEALVAELDSEIATAYERKASRGVAVGRLVGRECGACRLSITATNLDEILALPVDEVAECPNCQAFLVRT
jgi:predicted  nucleic acid-binding Zn-ribbon protein